MLKNKGHIWSLAKEYPICTIIGVGVLVRLLVALLYQHITIYPDSEGYVFLAQRLLDFDLSGYEGQRSPGYPLLLCLTGIAELGTVFLQLILGVFTLIYFYKTLLVLAFRKGLALFCTLFVSLYIPTVFFELTILTETLTLFIITLVFYLFMRLMKSDGKKFEKYILLAVLCAFLVLIKPFYIFLPALLFILLLYQRVPLKKLLCLLFFPLIVFFGWSYVNKVNTGHFVPTTYYGFNLAQNCVSFAEHTTPEYQEIGDIYATYREANDASRYEVAMTIWEAYPELQEQTQLSFVDLSNLLYDYSLATIKRNPAAYGKQVFISWRDFWKTSMYWEPTSVGVQQSAVFIRSVCYGERVVLQLAKILFVLLLPIQLFLFVRNKKVSPQLAIALVVFVASLLQAMVSYGTNSRFSFPFEMLMVISVLLDYIRYRKYRKKRS